MCDAAAAAADDDDDDDDDDFVGLFKSILVMIRHNLLNTSINLVLYKKFMYILDLILYLCITKLWWTGRKEGRKEGREEGRF